MKIKAVLRYDGSAYHGWQKQENAWSIQQEVEKALQKIHKKQTPITASGRTDAGVHALGQVIHFEGNPRMQPEAYARALNALLPPDIRVVETCQAPEDFHARFSARHKVYEYICTLDRLDPFAWRYKTVLEREPDLETMRQGAAFLIGEHDFTSFSSAKIHPDKSRIKRLDRIEIWKHGPDIHFRYTGNGFLRYQVRMMTGTLLAAGQGRIFPEDVKAILDARDKEACRWNAPPQGLYLVEVDYDEPKELSHPYDPLSSRPGQ